MRHGVREILLRLESPSEQNLSGWHLAYVLTQTNARKRRETSSGSETKISTTARGRADSADAISLKEGDEAAGREDGVCELNHKPHTRKDD